MMTFLFAAVLAILGFLCFTGPGGVIGPRQARKQTTLATSSKVPVRPRGILPATLSAYCLICSSVMPTVRSLTRKQL